MPRKSTQVTLVCEYCKSEYKKPLSRAMLFGELKDGGECKIVVKGKSLTLNYKKVKIAKV